MLLGVVRRRLTTVALCAVLFPALMLGYSLSKEKQYSASTSLLFRDPAFDQKLFGSTFLLPSIDPARAAATNVELVSQEVVAARTQRRLPNVGSVKDKVEVLAKGQSDVVSVTATDSDPKRAARIANTFAAEYIQFRRGADRAKIGDARRLLRRQIRQLPRDELRGSRGRTLREQSEQLQLLASLQTGNAERLALATPPSSPSSPKVARNTALGAVIGLIFGGALAFLLERFDRRIRDPKEMQGIFDLPILGAIPESRELNVSLAATEQPTHEIEAFRMLRANLRYFNVDRDLKSVLVTSAAPGDGKSTVVWNLAAAAAEGGAKVLAIEADLRHPRFAVAAKIYPKTGLSTVLAGDAEVKDAIERVTVSEGTNGRAPVTMDVLFAGPLPPNPTKLLESDRMNSVLEQVENDYDLVVVDTPPTSVVSDAIPLVGRVGGVIVVGRLARSTRDAFTHLRNQLAHLNAPTLGVVVNAIGSGAEAYGYGYGYGYPGDDSAQAAPVRTSPNGDADSEGDDAPVRTDPESAG